MRWTFSDTPADKVRDYWNARPCNSRHSLAEVGSAQYWDEVEARRYHNEPHIFSFAQFDRWHGKKVLEVGCGIGTDTVNFVRNGAKVFAIDLSDESVEMTRERVRTMTNEAIGVQRQNVEEISSGYLLSRHPDLIYSFGVLHHTPRPDKALRQLRYISKTTTEMRIMVYYRWSSKAIRLGLTNRRVARGSEAEPNSPVTYTFSKRQARNLLESTGWHVESMKVDHIFRWDGEEYGQHRRYVVAFPWKFIPLGLFRRIEKVLGWHLLIVARPKEV